MVLLICCLHRINFAFTKKLFINRRWINTICYTSDRRRTTPQILTKTLKCKNYSSASNALSTINSFFESSSNCFQLNSYSIISNDILVWIFLFIIGYCFIKISYFFIYKPFRPPTFSFKFTFGFVFQRRLYQQLQFIILPRKLSFQLYFFLFWSHHKSCVCLSPDFALKDVRNKLSAFECSWDVWLRSGLYR